MPYPTSNYHITYIAGSLASADLYIGDYGEISIDVTNYRLRAHDNIKLGGYPIETEEDITRLFHGEEDESPTGCETLMQCLEPYITPYGFQFGTVEPGRWDDTPWCPDYFNQLDADNG